jgi:tetratricopeptide (TPR) repeat protein
MNMKLNFAALAAGLLLLAGCPEKTGAPDRPADALKKTLAAAKAGDVETFKAGISNNYITVIDKYQEMAKDVPELKGAFEWKMFMKSLVIDDPIPQEEMVKGDKAVVKAARTDGRVVSTHMVLEHGVWKLEVPAGMVAKLDHFDEVVKMAKGEKVAPRPDINVGGGGKADRVKNLPPDASDKDRARAAALDAFDLGDLKGAVSRLAPLINEAPDDEELVVALGRAYVQTQKGDEAVKLFEAFIEKHPNSHRTYHYLGMAYLFQNKPGEAANAWKEVVKLDGTYAAEWKLDKRIQAAEQMAKVQSTGRAADPTGAVSAPAPEVNPPPRPGPGPGAAPPAPASQPGG